jgi:hypothetical protein
MFKKKTRCKIKHETLKIEKIQAVRAMYVHPGNPESQEVEIRLRTDEGELLELRLESRFVPQLLQDIGDGHGSRLWVRHRSPSLRDGLRHPGAVQEGRCLRSASPRGTR